MLFSNRKVFAEEGLNIGIFDKIYSAKDLLKEGLNMQK